MKRVLQVNSTINKPTNKDMEKRNNEDENKPDNNTFEDIEKKEIHPCHYMDIQT